MWTEVFLAIEVDHMSRIGGDPDFCFPTDLAGELGE
jgi:hypothetical protein